MTIPDLPPPTEGTEYKLIPECPDYAIGSDGSFWSKRCRDHWKALRCPDGKITAFDQNGERRRFYLPVLVLTLFTGPRPHGGIVGYHSGINPAAANLFWTRRRAHPNKGGGHSKAILTALENGESQSKIARRLGVSRQRVHQVAQERKENPCA